MDIRSGVLTLTKLQVLGYTIAIIFIKNCQDKDMIICSRIEREGSLG